MPRVNPCPAAYDRPMDTTEAVNVRARVTKAEAARMANVSPRQINRWAQAGVIGAERGANGPAGTEPTTYDPDEVMAAEAAWNEWGRAAYQRRATGVD